ncbi:MAG: SAM-dependent chlorinase/fluorinase [Planctomycetia bacterium]|nr:SAM-dependent chlorinase/fluorinase [Planctomycetia bacterium]
MTRVVTLTTDFGSGSGYVAELKGRLLHAKSPFTLVDIAHDVPPHDIRAAAWLVGQGCPAFPSGTLHIVVVDPGVGTDRSLIWARLGAPESHHEFLCPDNGVLTLALQRLPLMAARRLDVPPDAAATFHGRDVLAPLAARLVDGLDPESLGLPLATLAGLPWPVPQETPTGIHGEIIHSNLVTNLPSSLLPQLQAAGRLSVGQHEITTIVRTYGEAVPGTVVALVGSQGFIEAAIVEGRADERLNARLGTPVNFDAEAPRSLRS